MASVYDSERKSVYTGSESIEARGLPDNVAKEKAAYTVLASTLNSPNTLNLFNQTYKELLSDEVSTVEMAASETAIKEHEQASGEAAVEIATDSSIPVDQRVSAIEGIKASPFNPSWIKETAINQAAQFVASNPEQQETFNRRLTESILTNTADMVLRDAELRQTIEQLRDTVVLDVTPRGDLLELGPEFVESVLPFTLQNMYAGVANDLFPEDASTFQAYTLPGETQKFLSDKFAAMSDEELDVMLPRLREALVDNAGIFSENGFLAMDLINSVFAEELGMRGSEDFNWDRLWNNVIGVADATIVLGPLARLGFRWSKGRAVNKVMSNVDNYNPETAAKIRAAIAASEDGDEVGRMVGMTAEDVTVDLYPSFRGAVNSNVPANVVDEIADVNMRLRKIEDDIAFGINYTEEEIAAMQSRVRDAWRDKDGSYNQSFSELAMDIDEGKGFTIRAAFGPSDNVGFRGVNEALEHFKDNFPQGTRVDFVVRDGDTVRNIRPSVVEEMLEADSSVRTYTRAADARRGARRAGVDEDSIEIRQLEDGRYTWAPETPEVWYRVEQRYDYNMSLLDESTILFGGPVAQQGFLNTSWIKDPASLLPRFVNAVGIRAHDMGQATQGRMLEMADRAFTGLSRDSKINVINTLQEGSVYRNADGSIGRNFSYDDLVGRGLDSEEIRSYYTLRGLMDMEYSLNNTRVYNTLKRDGYVSLANDEAGLEFIARPMARSDVTDANVRVFDPDTNTITSLSARAIDDLYEAGGSLYRSRTVVEAGDQAVTVIARGLGTNTRQRDLTLFPLNYRPGYVTRFYDENYFVKRKVSQIVDGAPRERWVTVAATPTKVDGDKLVRSMNRQDPDVEFRIDIDQKLTDKARFDDEFEYLHRTGGIITGRRGDHLKTLGDAQAQTLDFIESMTKSITYTAGRTSHDDAIASLERRWVNTYGKEFNLYSIPDDLRQIRGSTSSSARVTEARQHAAYVQGLKGLQPEYAQKWKSFMVGAAENLENMLGGGRAAMHVGDFVRKFNPVKSIRGMSFNLLLASNPMRQLLLQSNQVTLLAGVDPRYMLGGGLARDFAAFSVAAATRNRPQWGAVKERAGRVAGISGDDFERLYDSFVRSGLPHSIDSHTFARDGLQALSNRISGNFATRIGRGTANALKAPMLALKKVGFDAGEWSNLAMSYLIAWKQFTKNNPGRNWRTKAALDKIAVDTREYALNMTRVGEMPYQRGVLSLATQFLSFQHKALLAISGRNRAFGELPRHKKVGMVVSQFLFYGADGFGLGARLDRLKDRMGWEIPEHVEPFLEGFVYDYMLNAMINSITQDDTNIQFSRALAPGSGVLASFEDLIGNLMTQSSVDFALGASASAIGRVSDAAKLVKTTLFDIPDLTNTERLGIVLQQGGQVLGGYNNYVKGQAMRNVGYYVSNSGVPLFKTTYAEGWARSLFGIGTEAQDNFFQIQEAMNGPYAPRSIRDQVAPVNKDDIEDIARTYYNRVLKIYTDMAFPTMEGRDDLWQTQMEAKLALENTLFAILPEDVAFAVRRSIQNRIDQNIITTGTDELINRMATAIIGDYEVESVQQMYINMLKTNRLNLNETQQRDVEALIDYFTDVKGSK